MLGEMGTELSLAHLERMPALPLLISEVARSLLLCHCHPSPMGGQGTPEQLHSPAVLVTHRSLAEPCCSRGDTAPPVPGLGVSQGLVLLNHFHVRLQQR